MEVTCLSSHCYVCLGEHKIKVNLNTKYKIFTQLFLFRQNSFTKTHVAVVCMRGGEQESKVRC